MQKTNLNVNKLTLCVLLMLSLSLSCLALTSCSNKLSGKYKSESGRYEIKFEKNGKCTWYQDGTFFEGTYSWDKDEKLFVLEIVGSGFYSSTVFKAEPKDNGLIVTGGNVKGELFSTRTNVTRDTENNYEASGECGDNIIWTFDGSTLAFSGSGKMQYDYWDIPWKDYLDKIEKVEMSEGITTIGRSAFENCTCLTSITIPDGVTSIGQDAFNGCASLTNIIIPDSVTSIGAEAFELCQGLKSITIPNGVTEINSKTFLACTNLTSITIPSSVTLIQGGAFNGCGKLKDVYYSGTEDDWDSISIGGNNIPLEYVVVHYS